MNDPEDVEPQDPAKPNSPKIPEAEAEVTPNTYGTHESCLWNGKEYSDGGSVCDAHIRYKCWDGKWVEIGQC